MNPLAGTELPFLEGAMLYVLRGFGVFPVRPRAKAPLTEHGCKDASTDPDQIMQWRERWPDANVAVATGVAFDVLDVDGDDGLEELARLVGGDNVSVPCGPVVLTPSGGAHLYYLPSQQLGNRARFAPGLDWRAAGGYIVAPPSVGANHEPYRWHANPDGERFDLDRPLVPMPGWLRDLLDPPRPDLRPPGPLVAPGTQSRHYARSALRREGEAVITAPVGTRNDQLNRAAFALARFIGAGLTRDEIEFVLLAAAQDAGLPEPEARRTIASGLNGRRIA